MELGTRFLVGEKVLKVLVLYLYNIIIIIIDRGENGLCSSVPAFLQDES